MTVGTFLVSFGLKERRIRASLTIFAHLQVIAQAYSVTDHIVGPGCEVHVANRALRDEQTSNHLGQIVGGNAIAEARVEDGALQ